MTAMAKKSKKSKKSNGARFSDTSTDFIKIRRRGGKKTPKKSR
jgi:hypothetical protein